MNTILSFLNTNSGALSVIFTAAVTLATMVYAALTWVLVRETRLMRQVQTEPRLEIVVSSFDFAIHLVRLRIKNIGLGPALKVEFKPRILAGGASADGLLQELTDIDFFSTGLAYFGPGQDRVSNYTDLTNDHDGKITSVLAFEVSYTSATGQTYQDTLIVDMQELKGGYQLGKPHLYSIAQSLDKLQKDVRHISSGFKRIKADVYSSEDRRLERIEAQQRREKMRKEHEEQNRESRS